MSVLQTYQPCPGVATEVVKTAKLPDSPKHLGPVSCGIYSSFHLFNFDLKIRKISEGPEENSGYSVFLRFLPTPPG